MEDLANYIDAELDAMADRNSKHAPAAQRVQMGLARTKLLKAITHWVRKKLRDSIDCDLHELSLALIAQLITEINATASSRDANSTLYSPESFVASDYKNWIKKVVNLVCQSYAIRPTNANPDEATDKYTEPSGLRLLNPHSIAMIIERSTICSKTC